MGSRSTRGSARQGCTGSRWLQHLLTETRPERPAQLRAQRRKGHEHSWHFPPRVSLLALPPMRVYCDATPLPPRRMEQSPNRARSPEPGVHFVRIRPKLAFVEGLTVTRGAPACHRDPCPKVVPRAKGSSRRRGSALRGRQDQRSRVPGGGWLGVC